MNFEKAKEKNGNKETIIHILKRFLTRSHGELERKKEQLHLLTFQSNL